MASPRHTSAGSGNKENISENGATLLDRSALHKQVAFSAKAKKKPAGFNLRKSIAWNPAFLTEEGVLDNSELSVLTGSELMANGSPSSGVNGTISPSCHFRKYDNKYVLKQVAEKSPGKLSAKYSRAQNQGRRLFSLTKTPQRGEPKQHAAGGIQSRSPAISSQKRIPRVPEGSTQKKVPKSTSTALMSRTPKKPLSSIPMPPRSTTPETTVSKSNKKLPPVKTKHVHRAPGLLPKSKIDSGPSMETDVVPAVAAIPKETSGSVKFKNPQITPSSFGGTTSTPAKPSALRMPSPSVGFFTQENAQTSHGNTAERNVGRFSDGIISSHGKPPRYKLFEDLKPGFYPSKVLSTNCTTASDLVSLPVTTDSNTNTLMTSENRSLSKIISTYSTKSRDVNYQERPEVYCSMAGTGATTQPLSSEKNDGARNSVPIVYKDTSCVEERGTIKEIEAVKNSLPLKATYFSTIEATCSSTKPTTGSKSSPSCNSSQRNNLSCQSKTESGSIVATDLQNSYVGEGALPVSSSESESCTLNIDSFQNSGSCDLHNTERGGTSVEPMEYTFCADQMPPPGSSSSSDGKPDLAGRKSILNDSLYDEGESALSEEPNTDGGTELETSKASVVTEDPMLHVVCDHSHSLKRTKCSPAKPEAPMTCVERKNVLSVVEDKMMVFDSNKLLAQEAASHVEKGKAVDRSRTNTILRDHLRNLVPFTEEWLAVMEACGQEVLEQKSGAVQNSPPDKTAPEPSPWSPVKRKAQDVGPFDCTKYSKSVGTTP